MRDATNESLHVPSVKRLVTHANFLMSDGRAAEFFDRSRDSGALLALFHRLLALYPGRDR